MPLLASPNLSHVLPVTLGSHSLWRFHQLCLLLQPLSTCLWASIYQSTKLKQDQLCAFRVCPITGHCCRIFCNHLKKLLLDVLWAPRKKTSPPCRVDHREYTTVLWFWRNLVCADQKKVKTLTGMMQHGLLSEPEGIWNTTQFPVSGWCQKVQRWPDPGLLCKKGGAPASEMLISARCSTNEAKLRRFLYQLWGDTPQERQGKPWKGEP